MVELVEAKLGGQHLEGRRATDWEGGGSARGGIEQPPLWKGGKGRYGYIKNTKRTVSEGSSVKKTGGGGGGSRPTIGVRT